MVLLATLAERRLSFAVFTIVAIDFDCDDETSDVESNLSKNKLTLIATTKQVMSKGIRSR